MCVTVKVSKCTTTRHRMAIIYRSGIYRRSNCHSPLLAMSLNAQKSMCASCRSTRLCPKENKSVLAWTGSMTACTFVWNLLIITKNARGDARAYMQFFHPLPQCPVREIQVQPKNYLTKLEVFNSSGNSLAHCGSKNL